MVELSSDEPILVRAEEPSPDTTVLWVSGEVDMLSSPALREAVAEALPGRRRLVIDLTGVRFLGTSGLAALIEARAGALRDGVELWLACAHRAVLRPLRIAGLLDLFRISDTTQAALAGPSDPARK